MIYEGVVNETERADFFRNKLLDLFQGLVQNKHDSKQNLIYSYRYLTGRPS